MAGQIMRKRLRKLVVVGLMVVVFGTVGGGMAYRWLAENVFAALPEDLGRLRDYRPPSNCTIYDADETPIDRFYVERRVWVPVDSLPEHVWRAFVAAEDRRFFDHRGVDFLSIIRAFLSNVQGGEISQGGSTITQQIVKNLVVGSERSYTRKLREAVLATRLERELSKKEVLELYINYVYLGSGNYGIEAAATNYFGISAAALDLGQAALLAGLVPAPSRFDPHRHPEAAKQRQRLVLGRMLAEGYVGPTEAAEFAKRALVLSYGEAIGSDIGLGYITEVRREIRRLFGASMAFAHGFHVHTALDSGVQRLAEEALRDALRAGDERNGRAGVLRSIASKDHELFLERARGLLRNRAGEVLRPAVGNCFEAMVGRGGLGDMKAGEWVFGLPQDQDDIMVRADKGRQRPLASVAKPGDVLRVCATGEDDVRLDDRPWAEGAVVVVENSTGRIPALVGGYDDRLEGFVRATQARRQPGSSFKPYVYATALLSGRTQLSRVTDGPISLPGGNGKIWSPRNFGGRYAGRVTMRYAMSRSLNTVSVRLAMQLGPARIVETAHKMGVASPLRADLPIALGSSEVTPIDQAMAYSTIARMGVPTQAVLIDHIRDSTGRVVGRAGEDVIVGDEVIGRLPGGPLPRAIPAGVAYELADMMREVVRAGTARRAWDERFDRAGKTGTTNDFIDAWFVGFTPRYTVAVWVGSDGNKSLGDKETGGRAALPAWKKIIDSLPHTPGERFVVPEEAVLVSVEGEWLGFPRGEVPAGYLAARSPGRAPLPSFPGAPEM
ncbi:MAG: penicillin-binding protein 1A [Hyphomicrobiaceae bacterium]|jgi:penicillin-binding protein 1A